MRVKLIGGPFDGQWHTVDKTIEKIQFPYFAITTAIWYEQNEPVADQDIGLTTYVKHSFCEFKFLAVNQMTRKAVARE